MSKTPKCKDPIDSADVFRAFRITSQKLSNAVRNGELNRYGRGIYSRAEVKTWAMDHNLIEDDREPVGDKPSGAGLLDDAFLDKVSNLQVSTRDLQKAEQAEKIAKSQASIAATNEKTMKTLREAGRLSDIREMEYLVNNVLQELLTLVKQMDSQITTEIHHKHKIDKDQVRQVLRDASDYLLDELTLLAASVGKQAEDYVNDQVSKVRRRVDK